MEIVIIEDLVASYRTGWVRIAKTSDFERVRINDVLRRRGDGKGSEELEVEAISDGRLFLRRGFGPTAVMYHPAGSVLTILTVQPVPLEVHLSAASKSPYTAEQRRGNLALAREAKAAKKEAGRV